MVNAEPGSLQKSSLKQSGKVLNQHGVHTGILIQRGFGGSQTEPVDKHPMNFCTVELGVNVTDRAWISGW